MLGLQIVFGVCLLVFVALSYLIPVLLLRGRVDKNQNRKRTIQDLVTMACNCTSAGVFIALFFLGLLPNVRNKFETMFKRLDIETDFPTTECVIVVGYFLTLSAQQLYLGCKKIKLNTLTLSNSQEIEQSKSLLNEFELENMSPNSASQDEINFAALPDSSNSVIPKPARSPVIKSPVSRLEAQNLAMKSKNAKANKHNHMLALTEHSGGLNFIVLVMATSVHAVFEGATLALQTTTKRALHLFIAILVHECLVAVALGLNTAKLKLPVSSIIKFAILFSVALPIGIACGLGLRRTPGVVGDIVSALVQGLAAGTFLHIIFQELIPSEFGTPSYRLLKLFFLLFGFFFFAVVTFFLMEN